MLTASVLLGTTCLRYSSVNMGVALTCPPVDKEGIAVDVGVALACPPTDKGGILIGTVGVAPICPPVDKGGVPIEPDVGVVLDKGVVPIKTCPMDVTADSKPLVGLAAEITDALVVPRRKVWTESSKLRVGLILVC